MTFTAAGRVGSALAIGVVLALAWSAGGVAGSDAVATIGSVVASPPAGLRFTRADLAAWSSVASAKAPADMDRLALSALANGGRGRVSVRAGVVGDMRWAQADAGPFWSVVQWTPAAPALRVASELLLMSGERLSLPASLGSTAASLARRLDAFGPSRIAVCAASLPGRALASPRKLAHLLAERMGAGVTEAAAGPGAAELFGRLPGAWAVIVAGRPINLEVRVTRTSAGLVVDIATPFVAPGGCTAAGDGALAA